MKMSQGEKMLFACAFEQAMATHASRSHATKMQAIAAAMVDSTAVVELLRSKMARDHLAALGDSDVVAMVEDMLGVES